MATAQKLAAEGMHLCIVYRDRRAESQAAEEEYARLADTHQIKVLSFNADAGEKLTITEVAEALKPLREEGYRVRLLLHAVSKGNLKPLVKNAKPDFQDEAENLQNAFGTLENAVKASVQSDFYLDSNDYQLTLHNMALSMVDWVRALHEQQLFASDARVIGLSSEGNKKSWVNYAAVSATKAALEAIVRSIALEYAPYGIRANVVQAGVTDTASLRRIPGSNFLKANARFRNPFGRLTRPEDVANAIYLLCRDEAAWINGALIPVDGGESNS